MIWSAGGPAERGTAEHNGALSRHPGRSGRGRRHLLALGPSHGIIFNTLFYCRCFWLFWAPAKAKGAAVQRFAVRGLADIVATIRAIGTQRILTSMTLLAGLTSFMVGNVYPQMPGFAGDLGHGDPSVSRLAACGRRRRRLLAGIVLEAWGKLRPTPRRAIRSRSSGASRCSPSHRSASTASRSCCCSSPASSSGPSTPSAGAVQLIAPADIRAASWASTTGRPRHARLQRPHGGPRRRRDRHPLVARVFGCGAEVLLLALMWKHRKPEQAATSATRSPGDPSEQRRRPFDAKRLGVFKLIASSNLTGRVTGKSAGFSPLRIRPAYTPTWRNVSMMLVP